MNIFDHAEQAYLTYVEHHPDHYILNVPRSGWAVPILVHSAGCRTVSTSKRSNYTTHEFFKIAFPQRDGAIAHAEALGKERKINWTICQHCNAEPKP